MQIPIGQQPHPELRRHLEQTGETQRRIGRDAALAEHDFVQPTDRTSGPLQPVPRRDSDVVQPRGDIERLELALDRPPDLDGHAPGDDPGVPLTKEIGGRLVWEGMDHRVRLRTARVVSSRQGSSSAYLSERSSVHIPGRAHTKIGLNGDGEMASITRLEVYVDLLLVLPAGRLDESYR